ncbi:MULTISPECIES: dihydrolipoyllysine-residue acetyltransferase [Spongiibacter]|uniref:dihydrolipoyllysine-residue acetyltransferase n=1 Tax=Spongiibacter TaxID=630749 RepID=UPI001B1B590B|nr:MULTISPECIES: dihydrolipoyllysine-residue acetyltransferase [Spongiibacter]MBO6751933.1 dihydrolipoyllysine-residue acetyltransferase [Spongiibacter sp.]
MATETIKIPDLGGGDGVEVIEVCVAVGDQVEVEDSLLVLESDKASMEVPAPKAGKVVSISLKVGDSVGEGDVILELDVEGDAPADEPVAAEPEAADEEPAPPAAAEPDAAPTASAGPETVKVPDIGGGDGVEVIELCVAAGDEVEEGDSLIVLESDKASMEVPAPFSGKVLSMLIKVGDAAAEGTAIAEMQRSGSSAPDTAVESPAAAETEQVKTPEPPEPKAATPAPVSAASESSANEGNGKTVYAGPAVRKLAREFGISLDQVTGSGPRGRVVKEDLHAYVKTLTSAKPAAAAGGAGIPAIPEVDFSQFGEIEVEPLTKLHKLTAANMHRSWLNLPHVTQFDDADITELEAFRNSMKAEAQAKGVKLTPLPFLLKAAAVALRMNPKFNASLSADGENMVYKKYVHIGVAVDTPVGLMVPVIRDVDKKSLWELAAEASELAQKAKERKLKPADMQGGCFTISSLGNIGGTGFTPIINAPEVAILGVSKLDIKPVWDGTVFQPRKMLPLSLSYDHRAINGADAGKFFTELGQLLADIRRILL